MPVFLFIIDNSRQRARIPLVEETKEWGKREVPLNDVIAWRGISGSRDLNPTPLSWRKLDLWEVKILPSISSHERILVHMYSSALVFLRWSMWSTLNQHFSWAKLNWNSFSICILGTCRCALFRWARSWWAWCMQISLKQLLEPR